MKQVFQLATCEIKCCLRSKSLWLLGTLAVISIEAPAVSLLLILFFIVRAVTRDEAAGFLPIISSLPHSTAILFSARALAVFCILLGLWPFMVVIGLVQGLEPAEWLLNSNQLTWFALKYIITSLTAISIIFLAGSVTGFSTRLYAIIGLYWIIGLGVSSNASMLPSWIILFLFGHGPMLSTIPATAVSNLFIQNIIDDIAVYQVAMAILFLEVAIGHRMSKRGEHILQSKLLIGLGLVVIIAAGTAGVTVCQEVSNRESEYRLALCEAGYEGTATAQTGTTDDMMLEDYNLVVNLKTAVHQLTGKATMKLKLLNRPSDTTFFTLRNCFRVEDVIDCNTGQRIEWRRDGSRLVVYIPQRYLPGDSLVLSIIYSGKVWEWVPSDDNKRPSGPMNFVSAAFSLLRKGNAWYPVPGDQPLYKKKYFLKQTKMLPAFILWENPVSHPEVPFALTVNIDTDSIVVSNLEQTKVEYLAGEYKRSFSFYSRQEHDIFVMSGPYYHERVKFPNRSEFCEVYCFPQHKGRIDTVMSWLMPQYSFYEKYFQPERTNDANASPDAKGCTVIEVPLELAGSDITLTNTVAVREQDFRSLLQRPELVSGEIDKTTFERDMSVLQYWSQDASMSTYGGGDIVGGIGFYVYVLFLEKTYGHTCYEHIKQALLNETGDAGLQVPLICTEPVVRDVFLTLDYIRTSELGDPAIQKIISKCYQTGTQKGAIDPADFSRAVNAVLAEMDWPQEKYDAIHRHLGRIASDVNKFNNQKIERGFVWGKSTHFFCNLLRLMRRSF